MSAEDKREFYIYTWFNNDWQTFFYVGKGKGDRFKDIKRRSIPFRKIVENWDCEPLILENNLTEEEALRIEDVTKEAFIMEGYPIIDLEKNFINKKLQRIGIDKAKAEGKFMGRKPITYPDNFKEIYIKWKDGELTGVKAMEVLGLKKNTFYKLIKNYENSCA